MATINKNTDLKPLKEYFLGKGTIEFLPLKPFDIPKKGTAIGDFPIHWHKPGTRIFSVECKNAMEYTEIVCPICEMLKPKTKWQRIKSWLSKLWN